MGVSRAKWVRWFAPFVRALVLMLVLPLATAGSLPAWARLIDVHRAHVCNCSVDHHDCVCEQCGTDHDGRIPVSSIKGRCGDDEQWFGGKAFLAIFAPETARVHAPSSILVVNETPTVISAARSSPPTPPPEPI